MAEQVVELQPGESKLVSFEAVPHEARTYLVSVNGLTGSFTPTFVPPSGEILGVIWTTQESYDTGSPVWQPISQPLDSINVVYRFRVKNTGNSETLFRMGYTYISFGQERWHYSAEVSIAPNAEGDIDFSIYMARAGTYTKELYLLSGDIILDSITITVTIL